MRSGRRDKPAYIAWVFATPCDLLCSVAIIECAIKKEVEDLVPLKKPYNVLLQQVFLFLHTHSRATRRQIASSVLSHPVFSTISPGTLDRVIDHLIAGGYVATDGEMLMLGMQLRWNSGNPTGRTSIRLSAAEKIPGRHGGRRRYRQTGRTVCQQP